MKKVKSCGCIIIENNKVLLIQQKKGNWGFPKGHVEKNETEYETAIREVKEETNLDVKIEDVNKKYIDTYFAKKNEFKEVVFFLAKRIGGEIKPQEKEIKNVEWVDLLEAIDRITMKSTKLLFQKVLTEEEII
jgi:8-oxo-dGTP pyrophosphatase MutT (NUDIX family)